jgi:type VI protein secretion system component Hcp
MPAKFLMTMQLQTQGKLSGQVKLAGGSSTTGSLEIDSFSFGAVNSAKIGNSSGGGSGKETLGPFTSTPGSGTPSSKAQQKPIRIVKAVDSTSSKLYHALVTNEMIRSLEIQLIQPSSGGKETVAQRVTLTNAVISKIDYAPPVKGKRREGVTLHYQELAVNGAKVADIPLSLLR